MVTEPADGRNTDVRANLRCVTLSKALLSPGVRLSVLQADVDLPSGRVPHFRTALAKPSLIAALQASSVWGRVSLQQAHVWARTCTHTHVPLSCSIMTIEYACLLGPYGSYLHPAPRKTTIFLTNYITRCDPPHTLFSKWPCMVFISTLF